MKEQSHKNSQSLDHRLVAYAIAGAGAVTLLPLAQASIVYTPKHKSVIAGELTVDLNNDGITDFTVTDFVAQGGRDKQQLSVNGGGNAGAGVVRGTTPQALALSSGFTIGPGAQFGKVQNGSLSMAYAACRCMSSESYITGGPWDNARNKYLGFRFKISGETHYGWARISVIADPHAPSVKALLTGYAYETTPNTAIIAGDTGGSAAVPREQFLQSGTLAHLSRGALGMNVWRREEAA